MYQEIQKRSFDFSIRIAELVQFLRTDRLGFPMCERLLDCGIRTGLLCRWPEENSKTQRANTQLAITYVREADYIIELARVAGYMTPEQCVYIQADCKELLEKLNQLSKEEIMEE